MWSVIQEVSLFLFSYKNLKRGCLFFILLSQKLNSDQNKELTTYNTYASEQWKDTVATCYKSKVDELIATCAFLRNQEITHVYVDDRIKFYCNKKRIHICIHRNTISCYVAVSVRYS